MRSLLAIAILFFSTATIYSQGGWTQKANSGYFKLSQNMIRAGSFFNPNGEIIDITTTSVYSTVLYGEYGITDALTGIVNAPVFVRSTLNNQESTVDGFVIPGDELNDIGDIQLGLKYGILRDRAFVLALSGMLKLPTGESVGGDTELLQTGDGAWGFTGLVHASYSFYPIPLYFNLFGGYQWRGTADLAYEVGTETVDYDDAFKWGMELGWTPNENWVIALKADNVVALNNGSGGGITGGSSIFGNRITFVALTPEVTYLFKNGFGVSASASFAVFGRNILAAPNYNVGVVYLLNRT